MVQQLDGRGAVPLERRRALALERLLQLGAAAADQNESSAPETIAVGNRIGPKIVLAVPVTQRHSYGIGDRLAGAVIIDPSNPFLWHDDGVITIKDLGGKTSGAVTAEQFPKSSVARAFSHQLAETLWLRGRREPGRWGIGYATDDNDTAWITADIITQTGFVPIRIGALAHSAPIDPGGVLFPGLLGLFSPQGMQTTLDNGPFTAELPCHT